MEMTDMAVSAELVETILGVVAFGLTVLYAWIQREDKKEAEEQGDIILAHVEDSVKMAKEFAVFVPRAQPAVDAYAKIVEEVKKGWNDKRVTTDQLMEVRAQGIVLVKDILSLIGQARGTG